MSRIVSRTPLPDNDNQALGLARQRLALSGLDLDDAKRLHMDPLTPAKTAALGAAFKPRYALKLNYHGPDGEPLADWPQGAPFYRLRYTDAPSGFAAQAECSARYVQPPNTLPCAYYPQLIDWTKLCTSVSDPLIITEGEIKAAKATKQGFPTIGLGGVTSFRAYKKGVFWLSSLEPLKLPRRDVYICFDSDYRTNPDVCKALQQLAEQLHERGAYAYMVSLPQLPQAEKVGLDDFLVLSGDRADSEFKELLNRADPLGLTAPLWRLNDQYCYVRDPGIVLDTGTFQKVTPAAFKDHLQLPLSYPERTVNKDGEVSRKVVPAAKFWLSWPLRKEAEKLVYAPGQPLIVTTDGRQDANTWPGWGCEPAEGDVSPFTKLVDHLFCEAETAAKEWFLDWCACPLQQPGIKMFSSAVVHGRWQGTGKSLLGYTLGRIYGKNFKEIRQRDLYSAFNAWAESCQFVLGDEITGTDKRSDADELKRFITQKEICINRKWVGEYWITDCINYLFTSNFPAAFFLEDEDRRFFIHEVPPKLPPLPKEFFQGYMAWLDGKGASHLFHWLLQRDLSDFNPAAHAYRTEAWDRMLELGRSDLGSWVRMLRDAPDVVLAYGGVADRRDLMTSTQILAYYDPDQKTKTRAGGIARELSTAGFLQVLGGKQVRTMAGIGRYFILRNEAKWAKASLGDVKAYLETCEQSQQRASKLG